MTPEQTTPRRAAPSAARIAVVAVVALLAAAGLTYAVFAGSLSLAKSWAGESAAVETVREALALLHDPGAGDVRDVQASALPGYLETTIDGGVVYVSNDGRFVIAGTVRDANTRTDLTAKTLNAARRQAIDAFDPSARIVFTPVVPRSTVTVFTDLDCPYCRRFQELVGDLNSRGVAVQYLPFPLNIHPDADRKARAVWCAEDRKAAFQAAIAGIDPGTGTCPHSSAVTASAALAVRLGLSGTPSVIGPDGALIAPSIAMNPEALAKALGIRNLTSQ